MRRKRSRKATGYCSRHLATGLAYHRGLSGLVWRSAIYQPLEERVMLDIGGANLPPTIVVGRTLSAYDVPDIKNNQETLTLTVYNQAADPISGVLLTDTLESGVTFASASQLPDQSGQQLAWSLGTIQPYERASVTLTVSLTSPTPTQLDTGASAYGTLDAGLVSWTTAPATLRTASIAADLLASTPDANTTDPYVQEKAAELNYDPNKIVAYLHNDIGYNSYLGSVRGARGTLWSNAGNALDVASLGVGLMRASGIPAQYEQGTLSQSQAQSLILSMFPASYQTVGYIPAGTPTADPGNDPQLLSETEQHYWFQFDSGSGMTDADTLMTGTVGQPVTASTGSFSEVPDSLREKTEIQLTAETFSEFNLFVSNIGLSTQTVLDQTFNDVDLVGRPLTIGNLVNTQDQSLAGITQFIYTYTPYLSFGDEANPDTSKDQTTTGTSFQEVYSNADSGLDSIELTGLFMNLTLSGPQGPAQTFQHTIFDRIGFAARQDPASVALDIPDSNPPAFTSFDTTTVNVVPGSQDSKVLGPQSSELNQVANQISGLAASTATNNAEVGPLLTNFNTGLTRELGESMATLSDFATANVATSSGVLAYFDRPQVIVTSQQATADSSGQTAAATTASDLTNDRVRVMALPGQASDAVFAFRFSRGLIESGNEESVGSKFGLEASQISAAQVFSAAVQQAIGVVLLDSSGISQLDSLGLDPDSTARITTALEAGFVVLVPKAPVTIAGQKTTAWFQADPNTGETTDGLPNGAHGEEEEELFNAAEQNTLSTTEDSAALAQKKAAEFAAKQAAKNEVKAFANAAIDQAELLSNDGVGFAIDLIKLWAPPSIGLATAITNIFFKSTREEMLDFVKGLVDDAIDKAFGDPPVLPQLLHPSLQVSPVANEASASSSVTASATGGSIGGTASASSLAMSGQLSANWTATTSSAFELASLSAGSANVTDASGKSVGAGAISLSTTTPIGASVSGNNQYTVDGNGGLSCYGPAESTLGVSGDWSNYSATVTGSNVSITVTTSGLTLNGTALPAGTYTITTTSATLGGSGQTTSPNFAGSASLHVTGGTLTLGPVSTSVTLGGKSLDLSSGATLDGYTGSVTVASGGANSTDTVTLSGNATNVLTVSATPNTFTTDQNTPITFQANVNTSFADTYSLTAQAPAGWTVTVDASGKVTATPAPGLQSGTFPVEVIAKSTNDPNLVAQTTVDVTIKPTTPGETLKVITDPLLTVPFNGAELPTAFQVQIHNNGPTPVTENLAFSNVPNGFTLADSSASVTIPAGQTGIVGVYLTPNGNQLPPAGTIASFTVTATNAGNPADVRQVNEQFTVPAINAFTLTSSATQVTGTPGSPTTATVTITNTGNVTANTALAATSSSGLSVTGLPSAPVSLGLGQSANETITLTPAANATIGSTLTATVNAGSSAAQDTVAVVSVSATGTNQQTGASGTLALQGFVNAGTPVDVTADVLSGVTQPRQALASYTVTDSTGKTVFTSTPVTISLGALAADNTVDLGSMQTTGFATGQYTIHVAIAETSGQAIAGATATDTLVIGSTIAAGLSVDAETVVPGINTVTSTLTVVNQAAPSATATNTSVTAEVDVPNTGATINLSSFDTPPTQIVPGANSTALIWQLSLAPGDVQQINWQSNTSSLAPAQLQQVALGASLQFIPPGSPSGTPATTLTLPGLNVVALEAPQSVQIPLVVRSAQTVAITQASDDAATAGNSQLSSTLSQLGDTVSQLQATPTDPNLLSSTQFLLSDVTGEVAGDPNLAAFAAQLATLTTDANNGDVTDLLAGMPAFFKSLDSVLTVEAAEQFTVSVSPSDVDLPALANQQKTLTVTLSDTGPDPVTLNLSTGALQTGVTANLGQSQVTLQPGASQNVSLTLTSNLLSTHVFTLNVAAADSTDSTAATISHNATAIVAVRPAVADVLSVAVNPLNVTSAGTPVAVSAEIFNTANATRDVQAQITVLDSTNTVVGSPIDVPISLTPTAGAVTFPLGNIDTTGLATGAYAAEVSLLAGDGTTLPGKTAEAPFLVGIPITASVSASPSTLPPGTSNVTTTITVSYTDPASQGSGANEGSGFGVQGSGTTSPTTTSANTQPQTSTPSLQPPASSPQTTTTDPTTTNTQPSTPSTQSPTLTLQSSTPNSQPLVSFQPQSPPPFSFPANDDSVKWIGTGSGNWDVAGNWLDTTTNTNHVPDATDNVTIDASGLTITVEAGNQVAQALLVKSGTLAINGGNLFLADASEIDGDLVLAANQLTAAGGLTLKGNTTWSGGSLSLDGQNIDNFGTMTLSNNINLVSNDAANTANEGGKLVNDGTIEQPSGQLTVYDSAQIDNAADGTYNFTGDATIAYGNFNPSIANAGTLEKTGGTGTSSIGIEIGALSGPIDANSGTLSFTGSGVTIANGTFNVSAGAALTFAGSSNTLSGDTFNVASGGTLTIASNATTVSNPTFNVAGGATVDPAGGQNVIYAGTVTGTGAGRVLLANGSMVVGAGGATFDFPTGMFQWTTGAINLNGNTLTNDSVINLDNANNVSLSGSNLGGTFINKSTITEEGTGVIQLFNGVNLDNAAGGILDFAGDVGILVGDFSGPSVTNEGTLEKTAGSGTSAIAVSYNNDGGTIAVDSGTIDLTGGFGVSTGGTFNVAAGAKLLWSDDGGSAGNMLTGTYTGSGGGVVSIGNGNLIIGSGGATFNFPAGMFQWASGGINLDGHTLTNQGTLTLTNAQDVDVFGDNGFPGGNGAGNLGGTLANDGTIVEQGAASMRLRENVVIDNQAKGTLNFASNAGIDIGDFSGPSVTNEGTIEKTGGSGTSAIAVSYNNNGGTMVVDSGTLAETGQFGVNTGGTFNAAASATLLLSDDGGSAGNMLTGTYTGSGGGTVSIGNSNLIIGAAGATFNFPAGLFQWASGGINLDGHTLTNQGSLTLTNAQDVGVFGDNGFPGGNGAGNLGGTLANDGTIVEQGAASMQLRENVVIDNQAKGTLNFASDAGIDIGDFSGPSVTNEGTVEKTGGSGTSAIAVSYNNDGGAIAVDSGTLAETGQFGISTGGTFNVATGATLLLSDGGGSGNELTGTYTGSGGGAVSIGNGNLIIGAAGVTFNFPAGLFQWASGGINLDGHTLTNQGSLTLANPQNVGLFGNNGFPGGNGAGNLGGTLVNDGTTVEQGAASIQLRENVVIDNQANGTLNFTSDAGISIGDFSSPSVTNEGTIEKTGGSGTSTISVTLTNSGTLDALTGALALSSTVNNLGTVQAEGGAIQFTGVLSQFAGNALIGGTYIVSGGGSISMPGGATVDVNQANITLKGAGSAVVGLSGLTVNSDSLTVTEGAALSLSGNLLNSGSLDIGPSSTVSIAGNYSQGASGTLAIELGGAPASGKFGALAVTGSAALDGMLRAEFVDGYAPSAGDSFTVAGYASASGGFAVVDMPGTASVAFQANVGSSNIVLSGQAATLTTTTTTLSSSAPNGVSYGHLVEFTATVAANSGSATPTGAVQFQIDGVNNGAPVPLSQGMASLTLALPAGNHKLTAFYLSDNAKFANSDDLANPLVQIVNPAATAPSSIELYYTTYGGPSSVDKVSVSLNQGKLTLGTPLPIVQNIPADGLIFLPNGDLLTAGGVATEINLKTGALTTETQVNGDHLTLDPSGKFVWTSPQPGPLYKLPIDPLGPATQETLTGDDTQITHIAFDSAGQAFYTSSGGGGIGDFGLIDLTTFTTQRIYSNLPAAHGISYDPFTGDLMLVGSDSVAQIDPNTLKIVSQLTVPGMGFDQGAEDGKGHLYAADNGGHLLVVDYSATGLIGDPANFVATPFLAGDLDDVAPLSGLGSAGIPFTVTDQLPSTGYDVNPTSITPLPSSFSSSQVTWSTNFSPGVPETDQFQLTGQATNMAPGEVRQISTGTTITATVTTPDGTQIPVSINLPPVTVAAQHIIELAPPTDTIDQGATATYTVELSNPLSTGETYTLSLDGLPAGETANLAASVPVPAGQTVNVPLSISVPVGAMQGTQGFLVSATTAEGAADSVEGQLTVNATVAVPSLHVHLTLAPTKADAGQTNPATYMLTVTNTGDATDTYTLAGAFPAGFVGTFSQTTVSVPPSIDSALHVKLTLTPPAGAAAQDYPFSVTATSNTDGTVSSQAGGTATVLPQGVQVVLTPSSAVPGSTYSLKVTNTGQTADTYNLSLASPGALVSTLGATQVTLQPGTSQTVPVTTSAANFAEQGALPLTGIATSQTNSSVQSQSTADLAVPATQSMTAAFSPSQQTLTAPGTTSFLLQVNNTGNSQDSYSATIVSTSGPITASLIGLDGQPTQSVPLFILPGLSTGALLLDVNETGTAQGAVTVLVQSLTNSSIQAAPAATVNVAVPPPPTLTLTNNAGLAVAENSSVALSNTMLEATDSDTSVAAAGIVYTLTAAPTQGTLSLNGQALATGGAFTQDDLNKGHVSYKPAEEGSDSFGFSVSAAGAATIAGDFPIAISDPSVAPAGGFTVTAVEGIASAVQAVATFTDPGGFEPQASYSAEINWGDGASSSGNVVLPASGTPTSSATVTAQHLYAEQGTFTVQITLHHEGTPDTTVTSTAVVSDPAVAAGGGFTYAAAPGTATAQTVAVFTDPGGAEAVADYAAAIDWGDSTSATPGTISLDPTTHIFTVSGQHSYASDGSYPIHVTLTHDAAPTATATSTAQISQATITNTGGIVATAIAVTGNEYSTLTLPVATFTDGDGSLPASAFSAGINWGDGQTSSGSVSLSSGTYTVTGSHEYLDEGSYSIHVSINSLTAGPTGGGPTTVSAMATIHEQLLAEGTVGSPNQKYIQEIYRDLFNRQAEPKGREDWVGQLAHGIARGEVAYEMVKLATAEEFQYDTVATLYQQYLHRAPEPAGLQFWAAYLYSPGGTIEGMASELIGSEEYFQTRGGGTVAGFLGALFHDVLGRDIDSASLTYFAGLLGKGHTTAEVAAMVFSSDEYHYVRVNALYEQLLDRPADAAGLAYFASELDRGLTDELVISQMLSSDEYYARSQQ